MPEGPSKRNKSKQPDGAAAASSTRIYPAYCHDASLTLPQWCPMRGADVHSLKDIDMLVPEAPGNHKLYRLHHFGNHPVKFVKLVGVVVGIDDFTGRKVYTIDDSSGNCVECSCVVPIVTPTEELSRNSIPGHLNQASRAAETGITKPGSRSNVRQNAGGKSTEAGVDHPNVPWGLIDIGTVIKVKGRVGRFRDVIQVEVVSAFVVKGLDFEVKFWNDARVFKRDVLEQEWVLNEETVENLKRKAERRRKRAYKEGKKGRNGNLEDRNSTVKGQVEGYRKSSRKDPTGQVMNDKDASREQLDKERRARARKQEAKRKRADVEEEERKERQRVEEEKKKRKGQLEKARRRMEYPSMAVRKAVAGKYDLLGI